VRFSLVVFFLFIFSTSKKTMDFSTPIHNAVQIVQKLPLVQYLENLNHRSTRNERIFVGVASFITVYNLMGYIKEKRQNLNLPPKVPFGLPLVGHLPYLLFMPNKFIDWCNAKYGEAYTINNFGKPTTIVNGSLAREALKADSSDLSMEEGTVKRKFHSNPYILRILMRFTNREPFPSLFVQL
jgi:hypothetical protein